MLTAFRSWQVRIFTLGCVGIALAILGLIYAPRLTLLGILLCLVSVLLLVFIGNRKNLRQRNQTKTELANIHKLIDRSSSITESIARTSTPKVDVSYEYADRIRNNVSKYESFALRSRSLEIRDAFSLAATDNEQKYHDLSRFIAIQQMGFLPGMKSSALRYWDPEAFLAIARIQANQRATETDLQNAVKMFAFAQEFFGSKALTKKDRLIYLEALGELGDFKQQSKLATHFSVDKRLPVHRHLIKLNEIQAYKSAGSKEWLDELNGLYIRHAYSPVLMSNKPEGGLLDRLSTSVSSVYDGPLVSVVVPTFQGGYKLLSAVSSLLNQSWKNIEVIVVDDGSPANYETYLQQTSELSEKVKVIRQSRNLGAYNARNVGVKEANGEYITVHDDDDWSHGDKIAAQAQHLMENPSVPGNMTSLVRATEDLKFIRINSNPTLLQTNFSSLMFRRKTLDDIGLWDPVNRGADSEFRDRLTMFYDAKIELLNDVPLSFTRTWEGSLTSGELQRGYVDPSRRLYAYSYKLWHQKIATLESPLQCEALTNRYFPVPTNMNPGQRHCDHGDLDVVFLADFRADSSPVLTALDRMEKCAEAGLRVGYIHAEAPNNEINWSTLQRLFEMQLEGDVIQVSLKDKASVESLISMDPSVTTFMDSCETNLLIKNSVLFVTEPPINSSNHMIFDLNLSLRNIDRISEHKTVVFSEDQSLREFCQGLLPVERVVDHYSL